MKPMKFNWKEWLGKSHRAARRSHRAKNPKIEALQAQLSARYRTAKEWSRVHSRRLICAAHDAMSDRRTLAPVSFLAVAAVLGVSMTVATLYSTSYAVTVDGEAVATVADKSVVEEAIDAVEVEGRSLLGYDYQVEGEVDYKFALALRSDLAGEEEVETYFYNQLSEVSDQLRKYRVKLDGQVIGVVDDRYALDGLLDSIKKQYVNDNTLEADFVENLGVDFVYDDETVMTIPEMEAALKANTTGETTYEVQSGDTFNAIAHNNDMSISDLKALNPEVDVDRLMVGDVLNVKELIPALSVRTVDHESYTEPIPCPVETRDDPDMYKGSSKIVVEGVEGESAVEANVTYVNGYEKSREVTSKETVREPTTTIKAVGTKERPKTASTGRFQWPIRGIITSYFGGRELFGRYNFHSGLDINARYGAPIKAADGGKVTFAGWKGAYGNLVIITHDDGTQTYYAHNSSLVVSAGQRVYQGQTIAKAGSTGRSTGTHCHFEIRINGTAVNPLNYLP